MTLMIVIMFQEPQYLVRLAVLIVILMDGQMIMIHTPMMLLNGMIQIWMVMAIILMTVSTNRVIRQSIDGVVLIRMETAGLMQMINSHPTLANG